MTDKRRLRRLFFEQTLGWAAAWAIGLAALFALTVITHGQLSRRDLDAELSLFATAIYGLTWIEDGRFYDEVLRREPDLLSQPFDLWILEPTENASGGKSGATIHLAPEQPLFELEILETLADHIVRREPANFFIDGHDAQGAAYRLHGLATYDEVNDDARAAILVLADPRPWKTRHARFVRETILYTLLLAAAGLAVGAVLSRRALKPLLESLEEQQSFLAAAAHELRTPVASLRAVCESAEHGDEPPRQSLSRIAQLVSHTGSVVETLLLLARLDATKTLSHREPVRLDLLVEALLPEDGAVALDARETTVEADPILLETALRNLIENARVHGSEAFRVVVREGRVIVEDEGSGFEPELLERAMRPFVSRRGSPGSGLGLAIVQRIAERHGGQLLLENIEPGGARATLTLGL